MGTIVSAARGLRIVHSTAENNIKAILCRVTNRDDMNVHLGTRTIPMQPRMGKIYKVLKLRPLCLTYRKELIVVTPGRRTRNVMRALGGYPCSTSTTVVNRIVTRRPKEIVVRARVNARTLLPRPKKRLLPEVYWRRRSKRKGRDNDCFGCYEAKKYR